MFDDKIGDVYKGGRKIGEVRRSNSGGGLAVGVLVVCVLAIGVVILVVYGAFALLRYGAISIGNEAQYGTNDPTAIASIVAKGTIYEAEDPGNTLGGGAYIEKCPNCSGGKVVFNLGVAPNVDPGTLQFNSVYVAKDGIYPMVIYYCDYYTHNNTGYISINGGKAITVKYPSVGSCLDQNTTIGTLTINIHLHSDNNTIKFYNNSAGTSYIDKIVIKSKIR